MYRFENKTHTRLAVKVLQGKTTLTNASTRMGIKPDNGAYIRLFRALKHGIKNGDYIIMSKAELALLERNNYD